MKLLKRMLLISSILLITNHVFGQITLKGFVQDIKTNEPLIGASVKVLGTNIGTIANLEGRFELKVPNNSKTLIVTFSGYEDHIIQINGSSYFEIKLQPGKILDEVLVVGYSTEKKKDLTGSVAVIKLKEVRDLPAGNIMKNIQGRVPGVSVITDGSPGSTATIRIRGTGTLNNNDPLYVIDGVPTTSGMHELNPADIASIQVLKDASSASIYGARAANGVIVITTKNANGEGVKVTFDGNFSSQAYNNRLQPLNAMQRGEVFWRASVNAGFRPTSPIYNFLWNGDLKNPILGSIKTNEFLDANKTMAPADTRWFDEISQNSLIQSYNLGVSKGGESGNAFFSLGYYNHDGIIRETNFRRINIRINSDYSFLNKKVKIGENFQISTQGENQIPTDQVLFTSLVQHPLVPVHTLDGGWGGPVSGMTDRQNPVRLIEDNKQNRYSFLRPFGNVFIEIYPLKHLTIKSNFGVDYSLFYSRSLQKKYNSGFLIEPNNRVNSNANEGGSWIWSNTANYQLEKGKHDFNFLLGTEAIKYSQEYFGATRQGYLVEDLNYAHLSAGSSDQTNYGGGLSWSLLSYFGKVNYSFNNKYIISATLRRDGSSRFGINNRYGNFPAASVGWRITEESFLRTMRAKGMELKFRASWGINGNQEVNPLAQYNIYLANYGKEDALFDNPKPPVFVPKLGTAYDISGSDEGDLPSGYLNSQQGNPNLKWESTTQTNFGLDFYQNKFSVSIDYFKKVTSNILYLRSLLSAVGEASSQFINGGSVMNEGVELVTSYEGSLGSVGYSLNGNLATLKNEILDIPQDLFIRLPLSSNVSKDAQIELIGGKTIGQSLNSFYGYVADGLFQNQTEVSNHATQPGKGIGRIRYKDLNNDGIIDNKDQTFIGKADPMLSFGLNINLSYKSFSIETFLQGVSGVQYYNSYKTYTDFASLWPGTNWGSRTLGAWTETNTSSTIPRLTSIDLNNEGRVSSYFIENASYLKLRNVQIAYQLPKTLLTKINVKSCRIYIQGQNLYTIKHAEFTGPDPENPNFAFPIPTVYTVGMSLSF